MDEKLIFDQQAEETKRSERKQTYFARVVAVVSGLFSGGITGWKLTEESKYKRLHNQLHHRNWLHSTPEILHKFATPNDKGAIPNGTKHFFDAPHEPDTQVKYAFDDLCADELGAKKVEAAWGNFLKRYDELVNGENGKNVRQKNILQNFLNSASKNKSVLVEGGVSENVARKIEDAANRLYLIMQNKEAILNQSRSRLLKEVESVDPAKILDDLIKELKELEKDKIQGLEAAALSLKGHFNKLVGEDKKIESNFSYLIARAREDIFERPLIKELMKSGNIEAGAMGHQLRHADGKLKIMLTSASVTVAMGSLVYAGVKWLQHGNNKNNRTHLDRVTTQRDTNLNQPSQSV